MRKKPQTASTESLLLALNSLGAPISKIDDVKTALRSRKEELASRTLEPVVVAWNGKLKKSSIDSLNTGEASLELEDGSKLSWPLPASLPMGYHKIVWEESGVRRESVVISA